MRLYLSSFGIGDHPGELLRLLGGKVRAGIVANAADHKTEQDRKASFDHERGVLSELRLQAREIDLRDFDNADALEMELESVDLLWVRGGNVFNLRRVMQSSGADAVIPKMLARDAFVYGGYSAGVCVLAPDLTGLELVDAPSAPPAGYKPEVTWDGLGVLNYSVAPHWRSDHPESEAVEKLVHHWITRHVPFIALRDGEVIMRDSSGERVLEGATGTVA